MKLFALLLLKFVCLSVGTNPEVEEAFDPDSGETSFQRRYVISVANKQEDCYYISDVKTNQVINFHFVVSIIVNILKPKYIFSVSAITQVVNKVSSEEMGIFSNLNVLVPVLPSHAKHWLIHFLAVHETFSVVLKCKQNDVVLPGELECMK